MNPHDPSLWEGFTDKGRSPDRPIVRFYHEVEHDEEASYQDGVPRFRLVHKIEIRHRDSPQTARREAVNDEHKIKFAPEWRRYQATLEVPQDGTPIEYMTWLGPVRQAELKAQGIATVEKLAAMPPELAKKIGTGMMRNVSQAKRLLAGPDHEVAQLRHEVAALERENQALKAQLYARETSPMQTPKEERWLVQ